MREILFRGKRVYDGEWVEGFYEFSYLYDTLRETHRIIWVDKASRTNFLTEVSSETVGQYTGLTVTSGKIFEHDIVTAKFKSNGARFNFTVKYSTEKGGFVFDNGHIKVPFDHIRSVRIIGNIHDNPELLKGGE
jgi:hypothetical protein